MTRDGQRPAVITARRRAHRINRTDDGTAAVLGNDEVMRAVDLVIVIVIGWAVFWLYWLVEARNVKAQCRLAS